MTMDEAKRGGAVGESRQVLEEFLEAFKASGAYLRDRLGRAAELATSEDRETAKQATGAFFTSLVERLADSFEPEAVSLYNRAFAQLIQCCRRSDRGGALAGELARFGLESEPEIVARAEALRHKKPPAWLAAPSLEMGRVIVLSRVTLGADVAITSVIIERMRRAFPRAEVTLVGGRKAAELFGGGARLSFKEVSYHRAGTALERVLSWIDVVGCVRQLTSDLRPGRYLIVDPDSRLTQLGLLPVSCGPATSDKTGERKACAGKPPEDDYLFFPSREYGGGSSHSLGRLTSDWLDDMLGFQERVYPQLSLARDDVEAARRATGRIKSGARPIVSINFGVGENPLKRVGDDFETRLVNHLIQDGAAVVLDRGAGEDETRRVNAIIRDAARMSHEGRPASVIEMDDDGLRASANGHGANADLLVWGGRIGMLAALIGESDLYIGYDSAGQHIAAALGVPSVDVFAGFSSPRMLDRWRPTGKAEARVVAVNERAAANTQVILSDVLRHAREMLRSVGR
jgi:ADP-heptose:LPS heptosyltransferase